MANETQKPIHTFAQCVMKQACYKQSQASTDWLACCKSCLTNIQFPKPLELLHDLMHEHLDLMCSQFANTALTKQSHVYMHAFMVGSYVHSSGKNQCNKDQIMWSAPVDLFEKNGVITGKTSNEQGVIRVYPVSRCEDGQIGDVLSTHQLVVHMNGEKISTGNLLKVSYRIDNTQQSNTKKTPLLVALISELASLSFNNENQNLERWTYHASHASTMITFKTNDEAQAHGWSGKTDIFLEKP